MASFSCVTPGGFDMCFMGGSCASNSSRASCSCPPGQRGDYFLFHFDNCATTDAAYLGICIWTSVVTFLFLCTGVRVIAGAKNWRIKRLAGMICGVMISFWLHFLFIYLEDGCYVGCSIFLILGVFFEYVSICDLLVGLIQPLFGLKLNSSSLNGLYEILGGRANKIIAVLCLGPFLVTLPYYSRRDLVLFNLNMSMFLIMFSVMGTLLLTVMYGFASKLQSDIDRATLTLTNGSMKDSLLDFKVKLRNLRKSGLIGLANIFLGVLPLPVIQLTLGSIPFMWVLTGVFTFLGAASCMVWGIAFLATQSSRVNTSSAMASIPKQPDSPLVSIMDKE